MIKTLGLYATGADVIESVIIGFQDTLVNRQIDEVTGYIRRKSVNLVGKLAPARYIAFNNGIIDLEADTLQLQEFTPDIVLTHKLSVDFVVPSDASNIEDTIAFVDKFFCDLTMGDTDLTTLLYELIGYCCYRGSDKHGFYLFSGLGANR